MATQVSVAWDPRQWLGSSRSVTSRSVTSSVAGDPSRAGFEPQRHLRRVTASLTSNSKRETGGGAREVVSRWSDGSCRVSETTKKESTSVARNIAPTATRGNTSRKFRCN